MPSDTNEPIDQLDPGTVVEPTQPTDPQVNEPEPTAPELPQGDTPGVNIEAATEPVTDVEPVGEPPIAPLDTNLMRDVAGQLRDLHGSLAATLEQNIAPEQKEHIKNAANVLTEAARHISLAIGVK